MAAAQTVQEIECNCSEILALRAEVIAGILFFLFFLHGFWVFLPLFCHYNIANRMKKDMKMKTAKPLGCSSQWASYIIWTRAVSAYEKYIAFAFIEFEQLSSVLSKFSLGE